MKKQVSVIVQKLHVFLPPRIGTTAIRLCPTADTDLIPVEQSRSPRPSHKKHGSKTKQSRINSCCRIIQARLNSPDSSIGPRHKTGMVVIRKLIHTGFYGVLRHLCHIVAHGIKEEGSVSKELRHLSVRVLFHSG